MMSLSATTSAVPLTDEQLTRLLSRARDGESDAVNRLCEHFGPSLAALARSHGADEPEGLAADALTRVFGQLHGLRHEGIETFRAYLYRSTRNAILNEQRSRSRRPRFVPLVLAADAVPVASPAPGPEDAVVAKEWFDSAVEELTPRQRKVIELRFGHDLTIDETAHALAADPVAIKSVQRRALRALRTTAAAAGLMAALLWVLFGQFSPDQEPPGAINTGFADRGSQGQTVNPDIDGRAGEARQDQEQSTSQTRSVEAGRDDTVAVSLPEAQPPSDRAGRWVWLEDSADSSRSAEAEPQALPTRSLPRSGAAEQASPDAESPAESRDESPAAEIVATEPPASETEPTAAEQSDTDVQQTADETEQVATVQGARQSQVAERQSDAEAEARQAAEAEARQATVQTEAAEREADARQAAADAEQAARQAEADAEQAAADAEQAARQAEADARQAAAEAEQAARQAEAEARQAAADAERTLAEAQATAQQAMAEAEQTLADAQRLIADALAEATGDSGP